MLVCNVSLRPPRTGITVEIVEVGAALDSPGTGNVVFATLVDDPASVQETVDAYLGEIMLEAAGAGATVNAGLAYAAAIVEAASAAAVTDRGLGFTGDIAEAATATAVEDATTVAGFVGTTFDAASVTNVNLTNGNLTATHTNTTSNSGARSIALKSAGKFYFEYTQIASHGAADSVVILASATTYNNVVGNTAANYVTMYRNTGNIFASTTNSGKTLSAGGVGAGDVYAVAVDLTAKRIWFRRNSGNWNGDASANPATGVNGVTIPGVVTYAPAVTFGGGSTATNDAFTANFGASAFSGTVPSGYTSGWPA